jgi:hypothetical protein
MDYKTHLLQNCEGFWNNLRHSPPVFRIRKALRAKGNSLLTLCPEYSVRILNEHESRQGCRTAFFALTPRLCGGASGRNETACGRTS